ncbi:NAD(P)-binding protein [Inquilinus sp. CAU 1745]|uniref:NAD(P)/FAD-dependent oxidoreductase n=1 Tax=Inquilinus sp. CAU 1745 TaxID=3140369 RepID=UPI00325A6A2D
MTGRTIIVGGGPAGAAAACLLARAGRPVLLIERDAGPQHKICGEFVSVEARAGLAALGIDIARLGASPVDAVRLIHGRDAARSRLPFRGFGLSRRAMDEALLRKAAQLGATVMRGTAVRGVTPTGGGLAIETAGLGRIDADTLFLATGKHELRGVRRAPGHEPDGLIGFKMHFALCPAQRTALEGHVEIVLYEDGYAGLQMVEAGAANLCLLVRRDRFARAGGRWEDFLAGLRRECPHLDRRLEGAVALLEKPLSIARSPYGFVHRPGAADPPGLFRLGDQVGVIQPFAGDGMAIALHSARLAAETHLAGRPALEFHRRVRRDIGGRIRLASLLYAAGRTGRGRAVLVRASRLWPCALRLTAAGTRLPRSAWEA